MFNKNLLKLGEYLQPEQYPYQRDLQLPFAEAIIGRNDRLIEAFRSCSCGQGANSRVSFDSAISDMEQNLAEILDGQIPFPFKNKKEIIVRNIPFKKAKMIISKFS